MKAAVLEDAHKIVVKDVADPKPGPEDIVLQTRFSGVCGSDLHAFKGIHPFRQPPVILGHELAGSIVEVGSRVTEHRLGDRVTVMPLVACGQCICCRQGKENICLNKTVPGVGDWLGTFAQYFRAPAAITFRLGENTGFENGTLAEPLAVGLHAVAQGRVAPGSRVLVLGAGSIGILTAMAAREAGAEQIVVTDLYDFNLSVARDLCGAEPYRADDGDLVEKLLDHNPDKFEVVFLCSGAPQTVHQATTLIQRSGRMVVVGMFLQPISFEFIQVSLNELEIIGSMIYNKMDFQKAVDLLDTDAFDWGRLITHVLPFAKAQEALDLLATHRENAVKILLDLQA
jgi:L-iditol 2-dehydrogenase